MEKRGLVLSGGGNKGSFQVGVMLGMLERGENPNYDFYSGVSVGSINALMLAQEVDFSVSVEKLYSLWSQIRTKDVWRRFKYWPPNITWLGPLRTFFQDGLYDPYPLLNLIEHHFEQDKIEASGKDLRMGVVEKTTGQYFEITEKDQNLPKWCLASAAFPFVLKSVIGTNGIYSDGGQMQVTPLKSAIEAGCTDIDIIITGPYHVKHVPKEQMRTTFQSGIRTIDLMGSSIWQNDLKACHIINRLVEADVEKDKSYRQVNVRIFAPEKHLSNDFMGSLIFNPKDTQRMIELGKVASPQTLSEFLTLSKRVIPKSL